MATSNPYTRDLVRTRDYLRETPNLGSRDTE